MSLNNIILSTTIENVDMLKVGAYAFFVLIAGMVLWRVSAAMHKRKAKPKAGRYFDTTKRDRWNG